MAALLLLGLHLLAGFVVETQLRHDAERELAALEKGEPLWSWPLRQPRDLVAGRPFGHATASAGADGLRVSSRDGQPFELGLPVMQPLDLVHWPLLRLALSPDGQASEIALIVQERSDEAACTAVAPAIPAQSGNLTVDLRALEWKSHNGEACGLPAVVSYMLRLRLKLPAGGSLELREASLLPAGGIAAPRVASAALASSDTLKQLAQSSTAMPAAPLLWLPRTASVETWLALRDRAQAHWPGAIIAPVGGPLTPSTPAKTPWWLGWVAAAIYGLLLMHAGLRRTHPAWPLVLLAVGPLWLIAGMQWGLHAFPPAVAAFVEALAWAAWQERRRRSSDWHWLGGKSADWLPPLALVPVAAGLGAGLGNGFAAVDGRHALIYVAWASLQQWLMLAVVLRRLERWPGGRALPILATATLFALLHTPNGTLMQLCFLAELWWAGCFLHSRRLLPTALAHAACALLVESSLAGSVLRSLEVSARFLL